ncbi:MAG: alpha/beta fold hydrolase [Chloroflexi bacterium]|nr:alpha/beta fold hydrolase [Chloroflexota bacterium]
MLSAFSVPRAVAFAATSTPTLPPWLFTLTPLPTNAPLPPATLTRRATNAPSPIPTIASTATATPLQTATLEATTALTATTATSTVSPTASRVALTLDPKVLAIDTLRARKYGGGAIKITKIISDNGEFQRALFEYPSDGLRITGMMDIPRGNGPFPVVILDHGYFKPSEYKTGDGTNFAADAFARRGYLTLASDYRCYGGSPCISNPLDVGYAIDVMNLIALVPTLPNADAARIGIWGHSMGGGVTARVLTISDAIKVGALYAAVHSDDEIHYCWLVDCKTPVAPTRVARAPRLNELDPDFTAGLDAGASASRDPMARLREIFARSSPFRNLQYVTAPVIIHHGEKDDLVPLQWSIDLADALNARGKPAFFYSYPSEGHVFVGVQWRLFMERTISFFDKYLDPRGAPMTADQRVLRRENFIIESGY